MYRLLTLCVCLGFGSILSAEESKPDGEQLFNTFCGACHGAQQSMDQRIAPPAVAIRRHYQMAYADKASFSKAVVSWVKAPDANKTQMPGAIQRYGLMPALPLADEQLQAIGDYLFSADLPMPPGYADHMNKMYGKGNSQGKGKGKGMQNQ